MEIESEGDRNWDRLPEFIIHQVLSYLLPKEAARTTVLSNKWLDSYSTSPFLKFTEWSFPMAPETVEKRLPFFDFLDKTLSRYIALNLRIHKLGITVYRLDHEPAYHLLDKSIGVAFDKGVKELYISIEAPMLGFFHYTLPSTIFYSPKMLTSLRFEQCKFPQLSNSECKRLSFPFLKTLYLSVCYIDDGMLQKLLSTSPSLEKIVFIHVVGFKKFRVTNLGELKILDIELWHETVEISIEGTPSLQFLKCSGCISNCLLKVGSTENLKCLKLELVSISDSFLKEFIAKCIHLEDLKIEYCDGLERISIVSNSLKHFQFRHCEKIVEAEIDAPSLLKLEYIGVNLFSLSLKRTSDQLKTCINIDNLRCHNEISNAWFDQLRKLLKGVKQARVSFRLWHENQGIKLDIAHDHSANPLPLEHETEYFMPHINQSSSFFALFVEMLFSSSRPTTIDAGLVVEDRDLFIRFLGSELMTATNLNCCISNETKCWRHYLKDTIVEVSEDSQGDWQPLHPETSISEFTFSNKKIRFSLKWYSNSNAQV